LRSEERRIALKYKWEKGDILPKSEKVCAKERSGVLVEVELMSRYCYVS